MSGLLCREGKVLGDYFVIVGKEEDFIVLQVWDGGGDKLDAY